MSHCVGFCCFAYAILQWIESVTWEYCFVNMTLHVSKNSCMQTSSVEHTRISWNTFTSTNQESHSHLLIQEGNGLSHKENFQDGGCFRTQQFRHGATFSPPLHSALLEVVPRTECKYANK